jgi:hypothetical protein
MVAIAERSLPGIVKQQLANINLAACTEIEHPF